MSNKISDAIVLGDPNYENTIFTEKFQQECTNDELKELYQTLYGWTTAAWYNNQYKKRLREVMKNIQKILKTREIKNG